LARFSFSIAFLSDEWRLHEHAMLLFCAWHLVAEGVSGHGLISV
jgi:hypothetical protein